MDLLGAAGTVIELCDFTSGELLLCLFLCYSSQVSYTAIHVGCYIQ